MSCVINIIIGGDVMWYFIRILLISLLMTLVIEELIAIFFGERKLKGYGIIALVNVFTNPATVYLYYCAKKLLEMNTTMLLYEAWILPIIQLFLECIVILIEGRWYSDFCRNEQIHMRHPWIYSIVANLFAWCIGIVISCVF